MKNIKSIDDTITKAEADKLVANDIKQNKIKNGVLIGIGLLGVGLQIYSMQKNVSTDVSDYIVRGILDTAYLTLFIGMTAKIIGQYRRNPQIISETYAKDSQQYIYKNHNKKLVE